MGKLKDFLFGKDESPISNGTTLQSRNISVPEKVFVEREGLYYEYSEQAPAHLNHFLNNFLSGCANNNLIELFYLLPEVFAPVHEIAKRVSDASWQLRKEWNDEVDYKDETFNKLFSQPNPFESFKDLVYQAVCYEILVGKQYFFFNQPDSLPDEYKSIITWYNLIASQVTAVVKKNVDPYTATDLNDLIIEYTQPKADGSLRRFPANKVLPVCHFGLGSGYDPNNCKSLLLGAWKAIENLLPVYEARKAVYTKRGALGFLVSEKADATGREPLTKTEKLEALADFQGTYGITGGRSPVGITRLPLKWLQTGMSIQDLQPFEETLADAVAIYKVLRVPRHLVPSKDNSTFANADADLKSFYQDVIIPWSKRYAEMWTSKMNLKEYRRYIFPDYSHIDILQENRKEKADVGKVITDTKILQFQNGAITLNDFIVAIDGTRGTDPIYDLKWLDMDDEQKEKVSGMLSMKTPPQLQEPKEEDEAIVKPMKKVV